MSTFDDIINGLVNRYRKALDEMSKGVMPGESDIGPACQAIRDELTNQRATIAQLRREVEEARASKDAAWKQLDEATKGGVDYWAWRARTTEAERDRYAEALREIAGADEVLFGDATEEARRFQAIARAALGEKAS